MYRAAFYEIEVTPPLGSLLPGHYARIYSRGVKDRLYIKATVINDGLQTVAMVVLDCCELPPDCHDEIVTRVGEYTGIKPEHIIIAANHTHAGAPVKSYPDVNAYGDVGYTDNVKKLMADCITLAYRRLEPVTISYACSKVYDISFNRNFVMRDGSITTNSGRDQDVITPYAVPDDIPVVRFEEVHNCPGAKIINPNCLGNLAGIDPDFPVLFFRNQEGRLIGTVTNFACHQTASGCVESSGDYSSILSEELKKTYGPDFVSLFLVGASGDINHIDFSKEENPKDVYRNMGRRLANEVRSLESKAVQIAENAIGAKKEKLFFERRLADDDTLVSLAERFVRLKSAPAKMMLRNALTYEAGGETGKLEAYVQCIKIGDVLFYALPGEMFVDFGLYIKKHSPLCACFITELANGPYDGYIPTREVFHPLSSLYEKAVCVGSCMEPEGGYVISQKALEFARELC